MRDINDQVSTVLPAIPYFIYRIAGIERIWYNHTVPVHNYTLYIPAVSL